MPNKTPFQHLSSLVKDALIAHDLHTNQEYVGFINTLRQIYPGKYISDIIDIEIKPDKTVQRGDKIFFT